ncbi:hypothetical protein D3C71_2093860 [compost metagenome]
MLPVGLPAPGEPEVFGEAGLPDAEELGSTLLSGFGVADVEAEGETEGLGLFLFSACSFRKSG